MRRLRAEGVLTKTSRPFDKGALYRLLNNPTYFGEVIHKGKVCPGEHRAIVPRELWDRVHAILQESPRIRANQNRRQTPALLRGLIFGPDGRAMSPTHTRRRGRLYRYYVSQAVLKGTASDCPVRRLPAAEIEAAVIDQVRALLRQPEVVVAPSTCRLCGHRADMQGDAQQSSGGGNPADIRPRLECTRPCGTILAGGDVVAAEIEEVGDLVVGGEEALCLPR